MDLTIVYSSAHKIPDKFRLSIVENLYKAAKDYPIIELHDTPEIASIPHYYRNLLETAKTIKTPYIAFAEDDTLYTDEHFNFRSDKFAYNFHRWNIFTWTEPVFALQQRKILATLICPTRLFIEAFEDKFRVDPNAERLQWWGEPGRNAHERGLGIPRRESEVFMTYQPLIVFSHPFANGGTKKRMPKVRATEIPFWGRAEDIMKLWN